MPPTRRAARAGLSVTLLLLCASLGHAGDGVVDVLPNRGQWPDPVVARMAADDLTAWLEPSGWTFALSAPAADGTPAGHALRVRVHDARPDVRGLGEGRRSGRHHWLLGPRADWVRQVPGYRQWRWPEIRPGTDLVAHSADGRFEYDVLLSGEARLDELAFVLDGAERLRVGPDGGLLIDTPLGVLSQAAPIAFSLDALGGRHAVACRAELLGPNSYRFVAQGRLPGRPLVVDPEVQWSTFVGGSNAEIVTELVVDAAGQATLVGTAAPGSYPVTPGAWDPFENGARDAVITKLSPDGSQLVQSTYLGGSLDDEIFGASDDGAGGLVLCGFTASPDFPTTPGAHDASFAGGGAFFDSDAFVAQLSADGSDLLLSSFLGGSQDDLARAVCRDAAGTVYVAGSSGSPDFSFAPGSPDAVFGGGGPQVGDAFVAAFAPSGAMLWGRFLGGGGDELINALAVDATHGLVAAGWTSSGDYPTTSGVWQADRRGSSDAVLTRIDTADGTLIASTLLGGIGDDDAMELALLADGRIDLAGTSRSVDFPIVGNAPQSTWAGGTFLGDVVLARLALDLDELEWSSYLGGSGDDVPVALTHDASGAWVLAGWSSSLDLPRSQDALPQSGGGTDAFIARIDQAAGVLSHLSVIGAQHLDKAAGLGVLPDGDLLLAGWTTSPGFVVTPGAYDTTLGGFPNLFGDAFVMRLELGLPALGSSWSELGFGLPGTMGPLQLAGNGGFADGALGSFALESGLPGGVALLLGGLQAGFVPAKQGVLVPWPLLVELTLPLGPQGSFALPYDLSGLTLPSGLQLYLQAWMPDAGARGGWAASGALVATAP